MSVDALRKTVLVLLTTMVLVTPCAAQDQGNQSPWTTLPPPPRSLERNFLRNLVYDQKNFWTTPFRIRAADAPWLLPFAGFTAGLIQTDKDAARHIFDNPARVNQDNTISQAGVAALVALPAGMYVFGRWHNNDRLRETGVLSGEAIANSLIVSWALKGTTQRERPQEGGGSGKFWVGGNSFPSNHAMIAWSAASVIAHEYPGPVTKIGVYGLAAAVSFARVDGRKHFPSDAVVGSALGWLIGSQVFHAHHDGDIERDNWGVFTRRRKTGQPDSASPYVPLDSWVYPALERLSAAGLVQGAFLGTKPWTRAQCALLVDEVATSNAITDSPLYELYQSLRRYFAPELDGSTVEPARIGVDSLYTRIMSIAGPPLTDGYHFGQTIYNDFGRPFGRGFNAVSGFSAVASDGPLAVYLRGEYQHAPAEPPPSLAVRQHIASADAVPLATVPVKPMGERNNFRLLDSYVMLKTGIGQLSFGKQSLNWGPGRGGSLVLSDNAEPMYMLRLKPKRPVTLPSFLHLFGPIQTDLFFGKLSGHRYPNAPYIHAQKLSFQPTPNLEFGVARTVVFGGVGHPLTPRTIFRSIFNLDNPNTADSNSPGLDPGDRRSSVDFSYRLPGLRRWLTLYAEAMSDDDPSPLAAPRRAAMHPGIYLSRLPRIPRLDLRVEGMYTSLPNGRSAQGRFFYWNVNYRDSYTNKGYLMGNWVGRAGTGVQAWSRYWMREKSWIEAGYRQATVDHNFVPGGGRLQDFSLSADFDLGSNLRVTARGQYESWRFPLLDATSKSSFTSSLQLTYQPKWELRRR